MKQGSSLLSSVSLILASLASSALGEEDILVGRSTAGQLKVNVEFAQPFALPASIFPGISGYATGELGLHSTLFDDPANDFFQLSPAADFRFILLAKDPGMEVWNDTGSGYMGIGDTFFIGPAPFDNHPIWDLVTGAPGNSYSLTLKLHDVNGVYTDSAPFILSFTAEPPPLAITLTATNTVVVSWPHLADAWVLEQTPALSGNPPPWTQVPPPYHTNSTQSSITVGSPSGNSFYRLRKL